MQKKKKHGGPVTVAGKKVVSKNALTHGATSPRLLSDEESEQYQLFAEQLTAHYQSDNPLVAMQIERIARLRVQLTRIQDTIDAAFQKTRTGWSIWNSLAKELELGPSEIFFVGLSVAGFGSNYEKAQLHFAKMAMELGNPLINKPTNLEELQTSYPLYCRFVYQQSINEGVSISEYLSEGTSVDSVTYRDRIRLLFRAIVGMHFQDELELSSSVRNAIAGCELAILQTGIEWFGKEFPGMVTMLEKIQEFERLFPAQEKSSHPDLDQMDKLMRYQTTLQRQPSTAIGELLEITRNRI